MKPAIYHPGISINCCSSILDFPLLPVYQQSTQTSLHSTSLYDLTNTYENNKRSLSPSVISKLGHQPFLGIPTKSQK